jgi:competence protein ComGC
MLRGKTIETKTGLENVAVLTTIEMELILTVISMLVLIYGEIM